MTQETDRELLEWAAKAAGYDLYFWSDKCAFKNDPLHRLWNPLTDDGDALRLAVSRNVFFNPVFFHYLVLERFAQQDAEDNTAYRRAIVRTVADEFGKAM